MPPVPNTLINTMSRIMPKIRENKVKKLIIAVDLISFDMKESLQVLPRSGCGAWILYFDLGAATLQNCHLTKSLS